MFDLVPLRAFDRKRAHRFRSPSWRLQNLPGAVRVELLRPNLPREASHLHDSAHESDAPGLDRRHLLRDALIGTSIGAAATFGAAAPAAAQTGRRVRGKKVTFDVACRGDTIRVIFHPDANPAGGDLYGSTFLVEGYLYRAGTIPAGENVKLADLGDPTGHWFCNSTFMIHPRRGEPHLIGHQHYTFGVIRSGDLFPRTQLVSHGMEGTNPGTTEEFVRAVTGGTGRYSGARGTILQKVIGTNDTKLAPLGDLPAPNFRFEARVR